MDFEPWITRSVSAKQKLLLPFPCQTLQNLGVVTVDYHRRPCGFQTWFGAFHHGILFNQAMVHWWPDMLLLNHTEWCLRARQSGWMVPEVGSDEFPTDLSLS